METNAVVRAVLAGIALAGLASFAPSQAAASGIGHAFAPEQCASCHPGLRPGDVETDPPVGERIHAQCVKCHNPCEPAREHATGRDIPTTMETALPLDAAGTMDCRTCHQTHLPVSATAPGRKLLRIVNLRRELCLNCHRERAAGAVAVITPPPGVTVREPELLLAGTVAGETPSQLRVRVNGASFPLAAKDGAFSTWVTLQEGVNDLAILAEGAVRWETKVLRPGSASVTDAGYRRLHRGHLTGRGECADCHAPEGRGFALAASPTAAALCYRCHDRFEGKRFLHGPVAVGACLSCHDPHGGLGDSALREEQGALCLSCHPKGDVRLCVGDTRGAVEGCTSCHDPHQSDTKFFRRDARARPGVSSP